MSPVRFNHPLSLVDKTVINHTAQFRTLISSEERLAVTLRLLPSGERSNT